MGGGTLSAGGPAPVPPASGAQGRPGAPGGAPGTGRPVAQPDNMLWSQAAILARGLGQRLH